MSDGYGATGANPPRRRSRNSLSPDKRTEIANRVVRFYTDELVVRGPERTARLQRYAKYRLWTNGTDWPWPDAADTAIPDMTQDSLRVQDTLVNAFMSQKPPVVSRASNKENVEKQETIDRLIEAQFFVENMGEKLVGVAAECFVNDPACTIFIPWVREKRQVADIRIFPQIPDDSQPKDYFFEIVRGQFPNSKNYVSSHGGWNWEVTAQAPDNSTEKFDVCFYTDEADEVEMVVSRERIVFDGPCPMVKDYDDVIFPSRSANLQIPGPSNPGGAPFVILRDYPILAEIKKLKKSGFYDLLTNDDITKFESAPGTAEFESESQQQKDRLQGSAVTGKVSQDKSHGAITRLVCFDTYDIDGDGYEEDVIFWVIKETKTLLKARLLSDMYPGSPPMRPLVGESFLPVGGRYAGMSQLELGEATHDAIKVLVDQTINANDLAIASPGYYRPSGGMNPEVLRIEPFTLSPLQNPQQDVVFPNIGNPNAMAHSMNMITLLDQWQDKTSMISDLNFGQVPAGGSSALRTIGGMSMVQGQGEARPERILRRFFSIFVQAWKLMHRLNQSFLPKDKQFRIAGVSLPDEDPYMKIGSPADVAGDFQFDFDANVLNTSKAALQQSLEKLLAAFINPLTMQLGVVNAEAVYRLLRDYGRAYGQNVDNYLAPPTEDAMHPKILAEEAIGAIMNGQMPTGRPMEAGGAQEHMEKLAQFAGSDNMGLLTQDQVQIFRQYVMKVQQLAAQEAQKSQTMNAASQFAQLRGQQGNMGGAPVTNPAPPNAGPPRISGPNEMMNETLPTAGGGANAAQAAQAAA